MDLVPDITICVICMRKVLDTEKAIQCEKNCERWFHATCMSISDADYSKLSPTNKIKWCCNRVDCVRSSQHPSNLLFNRFDDISDKINKTLAMMNDLSEVPSDISVIKNQLATVNDTLSALEPRIAVAEKKIEALEKNLSGQTFDLDMVFEEMSDRDKRSHNVIVYGVDENTSKVTNVRIKFDNDLIATIVNALFPEDVSCKFKSSRIGKVSNKGPRPLKIFFQDRNDAFGFFAKFDKSLVKELSPALANVSVSRDRTPHERKLLENLRSQLKSRLDSGETGLTIKYINNVPKIVTNKPKNY